MTRERGVFISYARQDGEPFALRLRARLRQEAPDLGIVWLDRAEMEGGVGWWRQITGAIERSEFMVLVMSASALTSATVQREWRYARSQGVCTYPVIAAPRLDFSALPQWIAKDHFYDLDKEWESFLRHLRSPCRIVRVPFMAPDPPASFVERPREFGRLKQLLLTEERRDAVALTVALRGPGGFGKTTLAAALCHDAEIQMAFDDGILWVTLAERPDVLAKLTTLYRALTGERDVTFMDLEDARNALSERLQDRNCLIVIDDVWRRTDLAPFLHGAKGCARLITTRVAEVAGDVPRVDVDEMTRTEAGEMLSRAGLPAGDAEGLAERLGNWPLVLELARSTMKQRVERGDTVTGAAGYLARALDRKGVDALKKETEEARHRTIASTIDAGLTLLAPGEREAYLSLAVFAGDLPIPLSAIGALWGRDELDTEDLIERLDGLALLKFDLPNGTVRVHDVVRRWMAERIKGREEELHARLLHAWGDPYALPDRFAWRSYAYHLRSAGRLDELRKLLLDYSWLKAKLRAAGANALVGDFEYMSHEPPLRLLQGAVRNSAHVLAREPQLAEQLLGRLQTSGSAAIDALLAQAVRCKRGCWLRPLHPCMPGGVGPLAFTLPGHEGKVIGVAMSADGRRAVSGSEDRTVRVWNLQAGREEATLRGHSDWVIGISMTADGRRAASASLDGAIKIWDLETRREERTLAKPDAGPVSCVAVSPDGRRAASGHTDGTLRVWDVENGRTQAVLRGHRGILLGVAIAGDGRMAVSGGEDGAVKVWDLEAGCEQAVLPGHEAIVLDVAVSADSRRAISASFDGTLKVWDVGKGAELATLRGHTGSVLDVAMSADGRRAVSASRDGTLRVWDPGGGRDEAEATLRAHSNWVVGVAISADGSRAVSASDDGTLKVWELEKVTEEAALCGHEGWVYSVAISADGRYALSASADGTLKLWNVHCAREECVLRGHTGRVRGVALTGDGRRAVSASEDMTVRVWDLESGREEAALYGHESPVWAVAVSPDGRRAVSVSEDTALKVWDVLARREEATLFGHAREVLAVALSADARKAVSASEDRTLKVWDLESGREEATLSGHERGVNGVAVSADRRRAVSASGDGNLKVWDLESRCEERTLRGHERWVNSVAVCAHGRRAVSGSGDGTLKAWDLDSGIELASITVDAAVLCCSITPDARTIVAGNAAGRVMFFRLEEQG